MKICSLNTHTDTHACARLKKNSIHLSHFLEPCSVLGKFPLVTFWYYLKKLKISF